MRNPKIWIYNTVDASGASYKRLEQLGSQVFWKQGQWDANIERREPTPLLFDRETVAVAGIANRTDLLNDQTFDSAPELRIIAKYSNGYDNVDINAATARGILVTHSPTEANWSGVAEGVLAYILTMLKKVRERDRSVKNGEWRSPSLFGTFVGSRTDDGYKGLTIGIIGFGRIGSRLAALFRPWGVTLVAYDPYVELSKFDQHCVRPVELDDLLENSDIVTLHCNLNKETRGIISHKSLKKMKPSSILVNAARGPCVDFEALLNALNRNEIKGAILDVLTEEPPDPSSQLLQLGDKVLLSPHMVAACNGGGLLPSIPLVEAALLAALKGFAPKNVVNIKALNKWNSRFAGRSII